MSVAPGGSREPRRMSSKTPVSRVRIDGEYFFKRVDSQPTSLNTVVPPQHSIYNAMRAWIEPP